VGRDEVWVEDDGNAKLMLFADGRLERTVGGALAATVGSALRVLALDGEGGFLMSTSRYRSDQDVPWIQGSMVRFDPARAAVDTLGSFDLAPPFPDEEVNPFLPTGHVTVAGDRFVTARSDRAEVVWHGADGGPGQIVRWQPERSHPTQEDFDAFIERLATVLERVNPRAGPAQLERIIQEQSARYALDTEAAFPLFGQIHGDHEGGVWVEEYGGSVDPLPSTFTILAPTGEWRGRVHFPTPVRLLDVRGDRALAVVQNEMDVQAVALYEIRSRSR
jgi:hypothetical protein